MKDNSFSLAEFGKNFRSQLIEAIKNDYNRLKKKIKSEQPCSVALVLDSDFTSLFLALNTIEYLDKKKKGLEGERERINVKFSEYLSKEELNEFFGDSVKNLNSLQWIPDEWRNGDNDLKNSEISSVSQYLSDSVEKLRYNYSEFEMEEKIIEEITFSLKEIIDEGFWKNDEMFFFVSMSDDDRAEKIEKFSAEKLNDKLAYETFLQKFQ